MKFTMKKMAAFVGGAVLSASAVAELPSYSNIYVFGDSLSDNGQFTFGTPPEFQETGLKAKATNIDFSSVTNPLDPNPNMVAVEAVARGLGLSLTQSGLVEGLSQGQLVDNGNNYAVGGAIALGVEPNPAIGALDTNTPTQIFSHLAYRGNQAESTALYAYIIGGNDLFAAQGIRAQGVFTEVGEERQAIRKASKQRVDDAIDAVRTQLFTLVGSGVQNLLVANAPDISKVPATDALVAGLLAQIDASVAEAAAAGIEVSNVNAMQRRAQDMYENSAALTDRYNRKLANVIDEVEAATGIDIIEWDLGAFLDNQIDNADELGYTNSTDACGGNLNFSPCTGFVFADAVHPTTAVHRLAGQEVLELLAQ